MASAPAKAASGPEEPAREQQARERRLPPGGPRAAHAAVAADAGQRRRIEHVPGSAAGEISAGRRIERPGLVIAGAAMGHERLEAPGPGEEGELHAVPRAEGLAHDDVLAV